VREFAIERHSALNGGHIRLGKAIEIDCNVALQSQLEWLIDLWSKERTVDAAVASRTNVFERLVRRVIARAHQKRRILAEKAPVGFDFCFGVLEERRAEENDARAAPHQRFERALPERTEVHRQHGPLQDDVFNVQIAQEFDIVLRISGALIVKRSQAGLVLNEVDVVIGKDLLQNPLAADVEKSVAEFWPQKPDTSATRGLADTMSSP